MRQFPPEFADLLSPRARADLERFAAQKRDIRREKLFWFPLVLSPRVAADSLRLLERHLGDVLRPVRSRIPKSAITDMRCAYSEALPKTISNSSAHLNSPHGRATLAAERIGLLGMLRSESLRRLAERLSGFQLEDDPGCQAICYREGDYVGPHNDHHPDAPNLRDGYVDFHLTLSNEGVGQHWLVFETQGFLRHMHQVGVRSGLTLSFLPFWHYTTPLAARDGARGEARRWLLLTSFSIKPGRNGRLARTH